MEEHGPSELAGPGIAREMFGHFTFKSVQFGAFWRLLS